MTSLGIVDLLDPRVQRAAASPSPSRQITPGAAAFADVILDASRVDADAAEGTFAGASTEGDTADAAPAGPSTPATNIPPAIVPLPEPTLVLPVSAVVIGDATGEVPAAAIPAPQSADAADAPEGAVTVVAAESAASAGSIGAPAAVAGTTAPASPVETAPAQPAVSETTRSLPLATTTTSALDAPTPAASHSAGPTATGVLGTAEPALPRTASTASRIGVSSGPISGIPVVAGAPSGPVPSAHAGAQETDAVPPVLSPDAPTTPAPAISASAPAPAASASTGDAPVPPAAVGSTPPPTPVAAAAPAAAAAPPAGTAPADHCTRDLARAGSGRRPQPHPDGVAGEPRSCDGARTHLGWGHPHRAARPERPRSRGAACDPRGPAPRPRSRGTAGLAPAVGLGRQTRILEPAALRPQQRRRRDRLLQRCHDRNEQR
jgi:flagellar hook-length control protein FliK